MAGMETQQGGLPFTLARIAPALAGYAPPKREFDPSTSWTHVYDVYTVAHNGFNGLGRLAITRREAGQNTFPLRIEIQRNGISGYHQFARAELICQNDALATPATWTFETKLAKTDRL